MRHLLLGAAVAAAFGVAVPAQALIYFSNYTPSQTAPTQTTTGSYPLKRRVPDATQSFNDYAVSREFQFGVVCCTFRNESVLTSFTVTTDFTATSLVVPMQQVSSVGNRNMAFTVQRLELDGSWVNARNEAFGIVPSQPIGVIREVEFRFGNNSTNLPQFFAPRPITFEANRTYRILTSNAAGGIGTVRWYLSDTAAAPGQSLQRYSYQSSVDLAFQPAFALTDGGDLTFPNSPGPVGGVPEPDSWALLILGFGAVGTKLRRRRGALA